MLSTNTIKPNTGSRKTFKRRGRGNGSGKGTFSGRGMNGQNCRSGGWVPDWFEGGQTPLFRRMPKLKGFSNALFKKHYSVINVSDVQRMADNKAKEVNLETLLEAKIVRNKNLPVKLLGAGEIKAKMNVTVDAASKSAIEMIEKAGGKVTILNAKKEETKENTPD